jgi:hypothetical protein
MVQVYTDCSWVYGRAFCGNNPNTISVYTLFICAHLTFSSEINKTCATPIPSKKSIETLPQKKSKKLKEKYK